MFYAIKICLVFSIIIALIYFYSLFNKKPIVFKNIKKDVLKTFLLVVVLSGSFVLTGHLENFCQNKKEETFKKDVIYSHEEIFIPLIINSVSIEDYTKELLIDKQIYNIKSFNSIEVTKTSSDVQGLVLYKINIKSNTDKKDINERIVNFNKNPIYILKEIRY